MEEYNQPPQEEYIDSPAQQQTTPGGMPYYQPTIMASEKADLYDKIKPEEVVEAIKYYLLGYEFNKQKQEWIYNPAYKTRALSELGAWQYATLMLPVSSKTIITTKLNDAEIRTRTRQLVNTSMKMALRNWKEYGIRASDQVFLIKEVIISNSFISLKQPENAGVRTFLGNTSQEQTVKTIQEKPAGVMSSIFRR